MVNNLQKEWSSFSILFDPYLEEYFKKKTGESKKYSPIISKTYEELFKFSQGGKKLRAFLIYLGFRVAGGKDIKGILPICLAFEIIHNFLLIHDDVIDDSDRRRGRETIHKIFEKKYDLFFGKSMAILMGDIAYVLAVDLIYGSGFDLKLKQVYLSRFNNILLETVYGQIMDVENSYKKPTIDQIWKVTDLKTARYSFVGPLTIGATLGGAGKAQINALYKFGQAAGTAFQIRDDILGVFGDEKVTGKSQLSDLMEGKNTILIKKTQEMANLKYRKVLEAIWGRKTAGKSELSAVCKIIKKSGALLWCEKEEEKLIEMAKSYVSKITDDSNFREVFLGLADFVVGRES